ncbi:hypothetical protein KAT08_02450 [Candidatus Babeliales bacterium]|nr:hypothetical protein [Candidatus Babeliales bacterium]
MNIFQNITKFIVFLFLINTAFFDYSFTMKNVFDSEDSYGSEDSDDILEPFRRSNEEGQGEVSPDGDQEHSPSFNERLMKRLQEFWGNAWCDCPELVADVKDQCAKTGVVVCSGTASCCCLFCLWQYAYVLMGAGCFSAFCGTLGLLGAGSGVYWANFFKGLKRKKSESVKQTEALKDIVKVLKDKKN